MKDILVLKLGSSTLTAGTDRISRGKIEDVARQLTTLQSDYDIVIVSSGAVATANQLFNNKKWENQTASKQAMSAIGQPKLMQLYSEIFSDFDLNIAQCLLTYRDFDSVTARTNTLNTILELLKHGFVPIINENDTVAVDELVLGDNDKLSAKVATLIKAKILLLASDIDGVYDKNPHLNSDATLLPIVSEPRTVMQYVQEKEDSLGTGGMTSKLEAAEICMKESIETIITNGRPQNFIMDCLSGVNKSTRFVS